MNSHIYLTDGDYKYFKTVRDFKNCLSDYTHKRTKLIFDKELNLYTFGKNNFNLEELKSEIIKRFAFISYEKVRLNTLISCCGKNYNFENYMEHSYATHDLLIFPDDTAETLCCHNCGIDIPLHKEDLQKHTQIHLPSDFDDEEETEREFYICECNEDFMPEFTFKKNDPFAVHRYILHLSSDVKSLGHQVTFTNPELYTCSCGKSGNPEEMISHLTRKKEIVGVNIEAITTKHDPDLKNKDDCPVCLNELSDIVYKCDACKYGLCLKSCAAPLLKEEKGCPMCRHDGTHYFA